MSTLDPTPKKNNTPLIVALIVVICGCAICLPIGAAILFPVFAQAKDAAKRATSLSNIKQLGLGMLMYSADYDDRYVQKERWCDELQNYIKSPNIWRSPYSLEKGDGKCDYAMIAARAGQKIPPVLEAPKTPVLFESGSSDWNQSGHFELLPEPPRYRKNNQPQALVAHADGSAGFVTYESLGLGR